MLPGGGVRGLAMSRTAGRWGERVVSHNATFKLLTIYVSSSSEAGSADPRSYLKPTWRWPTEPLGYSVDAMDHVYLRLVSPVTDGVFGIFFLTLFLMWFDTSLGLILGSILLIMLLIWPVLFYKLGKRNSGELTQNKADLRVTTLDWIEGYSELTLFGAEERYLWRF